MVIADSPCWHVADDVSAALAHGDAVVALESTVITHGLPFPDNLSLARDMEVEIRAQGAVPATIAVLDGRILVGANNVELERLARAEGMHKISARELGPACALGWSGGTTVAGTCVVAHMAGIRVFATGGIGGVHRQAPFDVSADLVQLARNPVVVVCAGAKAILDLPATLEMLETYGVPVVGYQTDEFPAFYSRQSGLPVTIRAEEPNQIAEIARRHWSWGLNSAVLVANPPPEDTALSPTVVEAAVRQALEECQAAQVHGQSVTPFLLERMCKLTRGESVKSNLALLLNNARLAGWIATAFHGS